MRSLKNLSIGFVNTALRNLHIGIVHSEHGQREYLPISSCLLWSWFILRNIIFLGLLSVRASQNDSASPHGPGQNASGTPHPAIRPRLRASHTAVPGTHRGGRRMPDEAQEGRPEEAAEVEDMEGRPSFRVEQSRG